MWEMGEIWVMSGSGETHAALWRNVRLWAGPGCPRNTLSSWLQELWTPVSATMEVGAWGPIAPLASAHQASLGFCASSVSVGIKGCPNPLPGEPP